jgi:hypothetical protein
VVVIVTTIVEVTATGVELIPTTFDEDGTTIPSTAEAVVWPGRDDLYTFTMPPGIAMRRACIHMLMIFLFVLMIVLGRNAVYCGNSKEYSHEHSD